MKKLLVIGAIVLAGLFVLRKSHLCSYAGTVWSHVKSEAKAQVPTSFELDRIRQEIARMDDDIRGAVGPIAEHMVAVNRLKKDIDKGRNTLAEHKTNLLKMTNDLKRGERVVTYGGKDYSAERIRLKLDRDFASYKRLETHIASQEKLLDAKERALESTREQLNKLIAKKQEFQVRLADLETQYEALKVAGIGNDIQIDSSRAAEIQASLENLQQDLEKRITVEELRNGQFASDNIPVQERNRPSSDLDSIRTYLEGNAADNGTTTASRK